MVSATFRQHCLTVSDQLLPCDRHVERNVEPSIIISGIIKDFCEVRAASRCNGPLGALIVTGRNTGYKRQRRAAFTIADLVVGGCSASRSNGDGNREVNINGLSGSCHIANTRRSRMEVCEIDKISSATLPLG